MEDLAAGPELLFRIQVRDNLIKSNEGKLKPSDIVEVLLTDRQIGERPERSDRVQSAPTLHPKHYPRFI